VSGLTPEKKEKLKELMGSCSSPISWSLVSLEERYKMISIEDFETIEYIDIIKATTTML